MAFSRRDFLKRTCCTAAAGFAAASFNRFGLVNAMAQSAQDYKALVCIFLFGGNDSNNMIVPMSSSWIRLLPAGPLGAGAAAGKPAPDHCPQCGRFRTASQAPRTAGPLQPEAPGSAGQCRDPGAPYYPYSISPGTSHRPAKFVLARGSAGADADSHVSVVTDRLAGLAERRTRFNPSTAEISPSSFRWRGRTFSAKACRRARSSRVATQQNCSQASATRRNPRAGCPRYRIF